MSIIYIIIDITLIGLGILILSGRSDSLIAGYDTATKKEQQKYDLKRIRIVVALILFIVPVVISSLLLLGNEDNAIAHILAAFVCVVVAIAGVIIINTWCKK